MAHIRTWEELQARELTPAEEQLIEACQKGERCVLGNGALPPEGTPDPSRHIRSDVLRYLILGGCDDCKVDIVGVWVQGAHITGTLELDYTTACGAIRVHDSRFNNQLSMAQTKCRFLFLDGCNLQGIAAEGLVTTGNAFLRNITTKAQINLASASIKGQLAFSQATFDVVGDNAIFALDAKIGGHLFLDHITTNAAVILMGTNIGGQLNFEGAEFDVAEGYAIMAQSVHISEGLFWLTVNIIGGKIHFNNANIGTLCDDPSCWPVNSIIDFDGMTYDRISDGSTDAKKRLLWLQKGSWWRSEFAPHSHTQLAKVLRDMGHDSDSRTVLLERDRLLGPPNRARLKILPDGTWKVAFLSLWYDFTHPFRVIVDFMFRIIAGYGHRPFRSIPLLIALIIVTIIPAHMAWDEGSFAPNSAIIQESDGWQAHQSKANPAKSWSDKGAAGNDWETFNRYAYGLDVVIPIINFGQTEAWAPSTNRGWWGKQLYWMRWVLGALGWIVTALGAAAITGVIRRD